MKENFELRIPIIFGWLSFHRKEQWLYKQGKDYKPFICCHWHRARWMKCSLVEKRLFCI